MKRILFICTLNSCRSQMAEAWAHHLFPEVEAASAGIRKRELDPLAAQVLAEEGVDFSQQFSKSLDELDLESFDCVITLCDNAYQQLPELPVGVSVLHRPVAFPGNIRPSPNYLKELLENYRRVRDQIRVIVLELASDIDK